jgi:predicted ATPase
VKLRIGAIGAPGSGKTTTMASVFAELKRAGEPVEFLPEYARQHIRTIRAEGLYLTLGNDDQFEIMEGQAGDEEDILVNSGDEVYLITDGSVANAFFYLEGSRFEDNLREEIAVYDVLFFCRNVGLVGGVDGNRVHDPHFSAHVDEEMADYFLRNRFHNVVELDGSIDDRVAKAMAHISNFLVRASGRPH